MATGYTPLMHAYLIGGAEALKYFPWLAAVKMLASDLVGVLFYITRFPESRFPGTFDIWVSSDINIVTFINSRCRERAIRSSISRLLWAVWPTCVG